MKDDNAIENSSRKKSNSIFFFVILFCSIILSFLVFLPFITPLVLAVMFAVVLYPVFNFILSFVKFRAFASILTVLVSLIVVFVPLSLIGIEIIGETNGLYEETSLRGPEYADSINQNVTRIVSRFIPTFSFELESYVSAIADFATKNIASIFSGTIQTVFYFFIFIFALFFFLKDGEKFSESAILLSPLPDKDDRAIFVRLKKSINAVIKGFLLIGLIQGLVAGIGFSIFGVPNAIFWGSITAIAALIPGVGTALIVFPAVVFLFVTGAIPSAIGLLLWGALAVGLIDNMLGPSLVGRGIKIHPLFVLFSVLGGIAFFGPEGFLLGPLVLSLLYSLLEIYKNGFDK